MNINLLYIILPIVAIAPVLFIKKYVSNKKSEKKYILFALIGYILLTYLYIKLLKKGDMTKLFCVSQIMQMLMIFLGSILIYAEEITINKILGVIISISAIYFFSK